MADKKKKKGSMEPFLQLFTGYWILLVDSVHGTLTFVFFLKKGAIPRTKPRLQLMGCTKF
jgi:hypothetical protein